MEIYLHKMSLWKRLVFPVIPPLMPLYIQKMYSDICRRVGFQVVKGWELGLAETLCCRKPQDVSLAELWTHHTAETIPTSNLISLFCLEINFNMHCLDISLWIVFREGKKITGGETLSVRRSE